MSDKIDKVLDKLDDHTNRLAKVETRLDSIDANLALHMKRTDQNESEIKDLQKFRWMTLGVVAFISLAAQLLVKKL